MPLSVESFLDRVARCTGEPDPAPCVRDCLSGAIRDGLALPERFLAPDAGRYARHLLARFPSGATAIVMVWGPGQGTPIHDHAGMWCVEGVLTGRIEVVRYYLRERRGALVRMEAGERILSGVGEAGALIPPVDHHTIANARAEPSATIHVYQGEMDRSALFFPERDGLYRVEEKSLAYTTAAPLVG